MHNPAAFLENDKHKILWDFDIQTDNLISTRRQDLIVINKNKKTHKNCFTGWPQNKTERKWKEE